MGNIVWWEVADLNKYDKSLTLNSKQNCKYQISLNKINPVNFSMSV